MSNNNSISAWAAGLTDDDRRKICATIGIPFETVARDPAELAAERRGAEIERLREKLAVARAAMQATCRLLAETADDFKARTHRQAERDLAAALEATAPTP